jgi:hypothetical protein
MVDFLFCESWHIQAVVPAILIKSLDTGFQNSFVQHTENTKERKKRKESER